MSRAANAETAAAAAVVRNVIPLRRYVVGGWLGGVMMDPSLTARGLGLGPGPPPGQGQGGLPRPAILPPIHSIAYVTGQAGCFGAPTSLTSRTITTETTAAATTTFTRFDMTMLASSSAVNDAYENDAAYDHNRSSSSSSSSSSAAAAAGAVASSGNPGSFCCDEALVEALIVTEGRGRVWPIHLPTTHPLPQFHHHLLIFLSLPLPSP